MTTSVGLTRATEFQRSSRARGLSGAEEEWRKAVRARRPGDRTSSARDLRTSHQGTESCNKCTQRRSCNKCTQRRSCDKRTQRGQRGTSEISAERDQWRRPPDERHQRGTSEASAEARPARDERDQGGARPVAQTTGRATSARDERGQRGSETSAERDQRRKLPDERARDDRTRDRSCWRARRRAALRKLSACETTGGTTEAVGA